MRPSGRHTLSDVKYQRESRDCAELGRRTTSGWACGGGDDLDWRGRDMLEDGCIALCGGGSEHGLPSWGQRVWLPYVICVCRKTLGRV